MRQTVSTLAIAFGLVVLVAGLFALVPDDIPDETNSVDTEIDVPDNKETETSQNETDNDAESELKAPAKARTVYGRRSDDDPLQPLRRVAPREPLSEIAAPENEPDPVKRRLLPRPIAIDAGHLKIDQATVVLSGIEAPAANARCGRGSGAWPCGARARTALRAYLRGRSVECIAPRDFGERNETVTSSCTLSGEDIARWIVSNGWAKALPDGPYGELEKRARNAGRGIWR
ncbi:thermonuclease family protein [Fulvimarina sp. MAC8]|uniref:thermonuclease family protein n=1 Tax=Fulvimarina sp. MAC8 TaxID=3162874 RepID=UPI0032F02529